jgi:hypothetical protein
VIASVSTPKQGGWFSDRRFLFGCDARFGPISRPVGVSLSGGEEVSLQPSSASRPPRKKSSPQEEDVLPGRRRPPRKKSSPRDRQSPDWRGCGSSRFCLILAITTSVLRFVQRTFFSSANVWVTRDSESGGVLRARDFLSGGRSGVLRSDWSDAPGCSRQVWCDRRLCRNGKQAGLDLSWEICFSGVCCEPVSGRKTGGAGEASEAGPDTIRSRGGLVFRSDPNAL